MTDKPKLMIRNSTKSSVISTTEEGQQELREQGFEEGNINCKSCGKQLEIVVDQKDGVNQVRVEECDCEGAIPKLAGVSDLEMITAAAVNSMSVISPLPPHPSLKDLGTTPKRPGRYNGPFSKKKRAKQKAAKKARRRNRK